MNQKQVVLQLSCFFSDDHKLCCWANTWQPSSAQTKAERWLWEARTAAWVSHPGRTFNCYRAVAVSRTGRNVHVVYEHEKDGIFSSKDTFCIYFTNAKLQKCWESAWCLFLHFCAPFFGSDSFRIMWLGVGWLCLNPKHNIFIYFYFKKIYAWKFIIIFSYYSQSMEFIPGLVFKCWDELIIILTAIWNSKRK